MPQLSNKHTITSPSSSANLRRSLLAGVAESVVAQDRHIVATPDLSFDAIDACVSRLAKFYADASDGAGEHPVYSRYDWQIECGGNDQTAEYWSWVVSNIEQDRAMWPWDRETTPAVLIARAATLSVEPIAARNWKVRGLFATSIAQLSFGSELEAWQAAAYVVLTAPQIANGRARGELEALPLNVLTHFVAVAVSGTNDEGATAEAPDTMSDTARAANHWVQVAQAAGITVQRTLPGAWNLVNGPDVPTVCRDISYPSEVSAWRAAAIGLLEHLRLHLESPLEQWQTKSPGQHLELAKTFYADHRPPAPDFAFTQHYEHSLKVLCQNVGWRVNKVRTSTGEVGQGWQLNRQGHYFTEADAWLAGADRIRRLVMQKAKLSYLEWITLSLDDQISLGLSHAR